MNKVAIITRTLNRPILLRRAAQSILNQTFEDYIWVVVNDGGEKEPINDAVSNFPEDKVIVIHNPTRVGMEAASNIGLKSSESEYVVIHDDDDTWHPEFLKKTVSYLDARGPSDIQQGVVTYNEL
ncbi:MAG: glycosyltransferase family 2 protein, partial [Proteobacteria bacterium]|nr:glycosyltransferase family 2 protein [Pseudomonadota bacterium]